MDEYLFTESDLQLSDSDLGRLLLDRLVLVAWEHRGYGLGDITEQMVNLVHDSLSVTESNTWQNPGLEKALRMAASGDYETAGQGIRHLILEGTADLLIRRSLVQEIDKHMRGPKKGGAKSAQIKRSENSSRNAKICADRSAGISAAVLAKRWGLTAGQVRRIIRDSNQK